MARTGSTSTNCCLRREPAFMLLPYAFADRSLGRLGLSGADDPIARSTLNMDHEQQSLLQRGPYHHHTFRAGAVVEIHRHRVREDRCPLAVLSQRTKRDARNSAT